MGNQDGKCERCKGSGRLSFIANTYEVECPQCQGNDYGPPIKTVNSRPTVPAVAQLVAAIYKGSRPKSNVGCCLHIAMDDGNLDDDDIEFCSLNAQAEGHEDCEKVASLLLQMTRTQRKKVCLTHRPTNNQ